MCGQEEQAASTVTTVTDAKAVATTVPENQAGVVSDQHFTNKHVQGGAPKIAKLVQLTPITRVCG